ncbi:pyridoxal phosphate-dependent aminotransferase [uncultured Clostridium sp.]|uniref:pyridoxal phosphate-dependent aminotransferase n=1 Tax=uncultured Clostridium sp. TaxID=59620 RepID=UPI0025DB7444|nr:pyridoxal phosphate-dependent aminotransferase [uncultured Clostridium sp.]
MDMNEMIAERMNRLAPSGIRKMNEKALAMERAGEPVIHFEIGRPDFDTPEYIKKACIDSINAGDVFYTSNFGIAELREAIAEKLRTQNGIDCSASEILVSVGLTEAVYDVLCSILNEGDEILIPDPVWINYMNVPKLLGAVPVSYHLREENDYQIDLDEIRGAITPKTKALVIISPNNPTGGVLSEKVLKELAEIASYHNLLVLADEVYERLIFDDEKHISIASLPGMKERTITLNGFSKAYSMTGWRLGYAAAPESLIAVLNKIHQHNTTCATSFVQKAAVAALRDEKDEVNEMVREYQRRRDYAVDAINKIEGISCRRPKGAFYIFINIKKLGKSSAEIAEYLLNEAKLAFVPGDVFGPEGEGYLRMSFANSYENIVKGCERLEKAIQKLTAGEMM